MCGIAGILGPREVAEDQSLLRTLAAHLAHRGPDDEGIEIVPVSPSDRAVALLHRRLSILDLSQSGHQPMRDQETGNWVTFNGEIYNFRDVRRRLQKLGHSFGTENDTEVILKAYRAWGSDALAHLRGMFAFGLWDNRGRRLFLAVDRLGIKPLYYFRTANGVFLFASEIRALLATGFVPRRIDRVGLETYLAYGAVQAPLTFIDGVRCLLPGQYLIVDATGRASTPVDYWSPPFVPAVQAARPDEEKLAAELRGLLEESVRYHLVSDVPVGVFLSGGIDSSSLVALVSTVTSDPPLTFSVTFPEATHSEARYSQLVARLYRTRHTEIQLTEEQMLHFLPGALAAMDQPTVDGVNVYMISRVVRETGLKAVLSGQGGDEVLTGYPTYRQVQTYLRYRWLLTGIPLQMRSALGSLVSATAGRRDIGHKATELLQTDGSGLSAYLVLRTLFLASARQSLLNGFRASGLDQGLPKAVAETLRDMASRIDAVNQVSLFEQRTYLANMLLRDGDFMSMAHGLEVRVPFLDHRVVEFAASVPGDLKLNNSLPKPLLLRAMGDLLPPEIYLRPKAGFTFPWEYWLRNQLQPVVSGMLAEEDIANQIGLNGDFVHSLWQGFLSGKRGVSWSRVWSLFVLFAWVRQHTVAA